jgi:hypothetical protein
VLLEHHYFLTSLLDKGAWSDCRAGRFNPSEISHLLVEEGVGLATEPFLTVWRKELYVTTQAYGSRIHGLKRWIQFRASSSQLSSSQLRLEIHFNIILPFYFLSTQWSDLKRLLTLRLGVCFLSFHPSFLLRLS